MEYNRYPHLTAPLKIGNVVLRNRMSASPSQPDLGQGPETYPSPAVMALMANRAKSGAAIVTCSGLMPHKPIPDETEHFEHYDLRDPGSQNYISQLAEAIHLYGAKASIILGGCFPPPGYDVSPDAPGFAVEGDGSQSMPGQEIPRELMEKMADDLAEEAKLVQRCGFDMVFLHTAYRAFLPSRFLSPITNHRTDEFGGDIEHRARFLFMICDRIKAACGKDFLIEASVSGFEPEGGNTLEEMVHFAKLAEGHIDILQVRAPEIDPSHVINFHPEHTPYLFCAEALKKSGTSVKIAAINGFHDPDEAEAALAQGKADMIAMARSWICDPEYGQKVYEGRKEDIVPCLRCNKCHISSWKDPFISTCSVNPRWGFEDKLDMLITPPGPAKKVAVIGGGPAGMEAALTAQQRGHQVTLFEKSGRLGGLMNHADGVDFKWTMRDFRDWMVRQIARSGVELRLNTEATPALIQAGGYDRVIIAVGGEPVLPPIPGLHRENSVFAIDAFYQPEKVGQRVVIIGGGEIGVEAGIYLARLGREVTVVEMGERLATDATPVHYRSMFRQVWEEQEGFSALVSTRCTQVEPGRVLCVGADGAEHALEADTVVVAAGMKPKTDEALSFFGAGGISHLVGDCRQVANLQKALRAAYVTASF